MPKNIISKKTLHVGSLNGSNIRAHNLNQQVFHRETSKYFINLSLISGGGYWEEML